MPLPSLDSFESILAIIVVFSLLVLVHELGHFLLAKRAGILCREFALGMGPKIFRFKRGETEYTVRALPIGGLVRMAGEDPELDVLKPRMEIAVELDQEGRVSRLLLDPKQWNEKRHVRGTIVHYDLEHKLTLTLETDEGQTSYPVHPQAHLVFADQEVQIAPYNRQFRGKTVGQRFWAIFAGPAANFLLAFVLLASLGLIFGVPNSKPLLGEVKPGGPAAQAGLLEGDRVLSIEGTPVKSWRQIVEIVSQSPNETLTFEVERNGTKKSFEVTVGSKDNIGQIMVYSTITYSPWAAVKYGAYATYEYTALILTNLAMLFTGAVGLEDLSGPVGIFKMTGEFAQQGLEILIRWAAVLSINLGLFNLLPLPALDGGRLAFLGVEALRGRPVDPQKEGMVHFLGFAFLMLLILVVTWNDLQRFIFTG
ncbi:RIP metalloprotease RseP [Brevibacillus humidisoli]|uniref:RIP metalloprotease RseP n=1 Tax=Brevibacillus humidisoli TaxID=2895522 RepID=UPI001E33FF72|nr:RIP metalloprotease RseP [Brevibacillus humidisoli]UFJ42160.1 RIP metalloprotease RseP [Brevibacillus humidisoli]